MSTRTWIRIAEFIVIAALSVAVFVSWRADRRDRAQLAATLAAANQQLSAADTRQRDRDAQLRKTLSSLAAEKRATLTPAQILRDLPTALPLPSPITLLDGAQSTPPEFHAAPGIGGLTGAPSRRVEKTPQVPEAQPAPTASGSSPVTGPSSSQSASSASEPTAGNAALRDSSKAPSGAQAVQGQGSGSPPAVIPASDLRPLYDFALDCQACRAKLAAAQGDLVDEQAKTAALTKERNEAVQAAKGGSLWRRLRRATKWFAIGALTGAAASRLVH